MNISKYHSIKCKQMSTGSFKNKATYKLLKIVYNIDMYKQDFGIM